LSVSKEQRPVHGDEERETDHLRAPPLDGEERQAPDDQHQYGNGHGSDGAPPEDERRRRQVDAGRDHGHEAPRRRDSGDDQIPLVRSPSQGEDLSHRAALGGAIR
jgi:hypothetical protein